MVKGLTYHSGKDAEVVKLEYVWMDGLDPESEKLTSEARSKTKILDVRGISFEELEIPDWNFDGSSTYQAKGKFSDCILKPVRLFYDPFRNNGTERIPHLLVLNEVYTQEEKAHTSNTRAHLREIGEKFDSEGFWFGVEQEYTFLRKNGRPIGFPEEGYPEEQGPYYCGVGADRIFGRDLMEDHLDLCLKAGLLVAGTNGEVMPGQWEYQIGPRGKDTPLEADPLLIADHLSMARYLMGRVAEKYGFVASLDPKPHRKWNGAGAHTNFSTKAMREGSSSFEEIITRMEEKHMEHIAAYGDKIQKRLIGIHETSSCDKFSAGVLDRTASVRIPGHCLREGKGYLEDRRPNANMDPYLVFARIMETVGGN